MSEGAPPQADPDVTAHLAGVTPVKRRRDAETLVGIYSRITREPATVVYLADGIGAHAELLARLGPHTTGVGCLYLKDLEQVRLDVLEEVIARSYATLTSATYTKRAREGRPEPDSGVARGSTG